MCDSRVRRSVQRMNQRINSLESAKPLPAPSPNNRPNARRLPVLPGEVDVRAVLSIAKAGAVDDQALFAALHVDYDFGDRGIG